MLESMVMIIKLELDDKKEEQFAKLKESLGLLTDTEVVRYCVNKCYKDLVLDCKAEVNS